MYEDIVYIFFYINLGLVFCALAQGTVVAVLCKKTAYRVQTGLTALFITGFSIIAFLIQLIMVSLGNESAPIVVYMAFGLYYCGFIASIVYYFLLGYRSNKKLCIATGIFTIVPPIGVILAIKLSFKLHRDTAAQEMVFTGYAYTFGAARAFCERNKPEYIDDDGEDNYEKLTPKEAKAYVAKLKKRAKHDPEDMFNYAEALMYYMPQKIKEAIAAMNAAAKKNNGPALYNLGYYYETGYYYKKDPKKARELYTRARDLGDKDAAIRLAIIDAKNGKSERAAEEFGKLSGESACAKYNYALCRELGDGVERDEDMAISLFDACARSGMFIAQKHIFMLAAGCLNSSDNDALFAKLAALRYTGDFGDVMCGIVAVRNKRAADAAECFLRAVKWHKKWEGIARLFVGTLYMDSGRLMVDKRNGAAYVKSAMPLTPLAKEIYLTVPKVLTGKSIKEKPIRQKPAKTPKTQTSKPDPAPEPDDGTDANGVNAPEPASAPDVVQTVPTPPVEPVPTVEAEPMAAEPVVQAFAEQSEAGEKTAAETRFADSQLADADAYIPEALPMDGDEPAGKAAKTKKQKPVKPKKSAADNRKQKKSGSEEDDFDSF